MKIAFHSYKGGVGRTKVMIAAGALMAMKKCRVGMLDFDLDSSSLATIFNYQRKKDAKDEIELLKVLHDGTEQDVPDAFIDVDEVLEAAFGDKPEAPGRLRYLPTISDPKISELVQLQTKQAFLGELFRTIDEDCGVDYVLMDIKPGMSPSYREVIDFVDRVVIVSRVDNQNLEGLRQIIDGLKEKKPLLVVNMVPESDKSRRRIEELEEICGMKVTAEIGYDAELFFDDDVQTVAVEGGNFRSGIEKVVDVLLKE